MPPHTCGCSHVYRFYNFYARYDVLMRLQYTVITIFIVIINIHHVLFVV